MSALREAIFAKAKERGLTDEETGVLFQRVDAALQQFVGQPKTTELQLRVAIVGTAALDQAFAEIERKRALDRLGPPDEIDRKTHLRSHAWVCSTCARLAVSASPRMSPFPTQRHVRVAEKSYSRP